MIIIQNIQNDDLIPNKIIKSKFTNLLKRSIMKLLFFLRLALMCFGHKFTFYLILIFCCSSCIRQENKNNEDLKFTSTSLKYAKGFKINNYDSYKIVSISAPYMNSSQGLQYILTTDKNKLPKHLFNNDKIIYIPINTIVCTSTSHLPLLEYLNVSEKLVGFPNTDYISSQKIRSRIDSGFVKDLGIDNNLNIEVLTDLNPDLVMSYSIDGDLNQLHVIEKLGISTMLNSEYLEEHPLGRAEWIKLMAILFNKEKTADSVFNAIEKNYLELKNIAKKAKNKPSVFSGIVYGDVWYAPGGRSYASQFFKDAQANYLWSQNTNKGFLSLSFESVYDKAQNADFWIGVSNYSSLNSLSNADKRYTNFLPFESQTIYTNSWKKGEKGGSIYLELGYIRPDLILKDLINIFHPTLLNDNELFFYKKLDEQ